MRITALVDDCGNGICRTVHGLSLYAETESHKILFDVGPDDTLFLNAEKLGIDLKNVDTVIISHGHNDHGGALRKTLEFNDKAKVFIQRRAFANYISYSTGNARFIGLDASLSDNPRIITVENDYRIDEELSLITAYDNYIVGGAFNEGLFCGEKKDRFDHEQHLLIENNDKTVLITGCAHCGVNAVMKKAGSHSIDYLIGGLHLPDKFYSEDLLDKVSEELSQYKNTEFIACHCTGEKAFSYLKRSLRNLRRIKCGDSLEI